MIRGGCRAPRDTADRFRGGLVFKAHRLCVSLNSRLESNKEEERPGCIVVGIGCVEGAELRAIQPPAAQPGKLFFTLKPRVE